MSKIRTKNVVDGTIKTLDKSVVGLERTKDVLVNIKEKSENAYNSDSNINEYASKKIEFTSNRASDELVVKFNNSGKKAVSTTKNNLIKSKDKIKTVKTKLAEKRKLNKTKRAVKGIKTSNKVAAQQTKQITKHTIKTSQRAKNLAISTTKKTVQGLRAVLKITISSVKAIISGTKALISALIAGGWIALIVIVVICLIGLLCSSIFGIFFSSEDTGTGTTMNMVVQDINKEMTDKIKNIQDTNAHDDYIIETDRAEWKEVLAIYTAMVNNGINATEVITIDDSKTEQLKNIFWEMHDISYELKEEIVEETLDNQLRKILYIKITSKSVEEMMNKYMFTTIQKQQVNDLLSNDYSSMWSSVIYGTSIGSPDMVQIALSQVGNVGGETYWRWYGFDARVEWCAIFVSWVANQLGFIDDGIIPKFSLCETGVNWFKALGQWQDESYIPKASDIIFFDWEQDGNVDHVGIVEKVENNIIYTIEGNSTNDSCRKKEYPLNNNVIYGYGVPAY